MHKIAPVGLQYNPKTLWFDANGLDIHPGDALVVQTERGQEFAHAVDVVFEASDEQLETLKSPLKPVLKIADDNDKQRARDLEQLSRDALAPFKEIAEETNPEMHPVMVEYLFEGDKAIFYFSADDRIDFRELVRKLAAHFHVRVDMRQIGVRDEARVVGGLGHCGQELCCKRLGGEFMPVTIRMAKEQDLSLNPSKISGVCGRLMCCLRYENEAYKECKCRCPKMGANISTPCGCARVTEINVPKERIGLRLEDGKQIKVPLSDLSRSNPDVRPDTLDEEALERALEQEEMAQSSTVSVVDFSSSLFTGSEQLADGRARRTNGEDASEEGLVPSRKSRRRSTAQDIEPIAKPRRQERRRRRRDAGSAQSAEATETTTRTNTQAVGYPPSSRASRRPGHAMRSERQGALRAFEKATQTRRDDANAEAVKDTGGSIGDMGSRRRRRRRPKAGASLEYRGASQQTRQGQAAEGIKVQAAEATREEIRPEGSQNSDRASQLATGRSGRARRQRRNRSARSSEWDIQTEQPDHKTQD